VPKNRQWLLSKAERGYGCHDDDLDEDVVSGFVEED
jgi:hypothetical protein